MRYLLTLNIIQSACLAGGNIDQPACFFIREIARYLRRGYITRIFMIRNDYDQARYCLEDPIFREGLNSNPTLLRDLVFIVGCVSVLEPSHDVVDRARKLRIPALDAIRLSSGVVLGVDGIITLEPQDFIHDPQDAEELNINGKIEVLVERIQNLDPGTDGIDSSMDEIRVLVYTPYTFIRDMSIRIESRLEFPSSEEDLANDDDCCLDNQSTDVTQVALSNLKIVFGDTEDQTVFVRIHNQFGEESCYEESFTCGEIDAVFFAINRCVERFTMLPAYHLHYTVTSAQGIPSPVRIEIGLLYLNTVFMGVESGDSTVRCTAKAYIQALNRVLRYSRAIGN